MKSLEHFNKINEVNASSSVNGDAQLKPSTISFKTEKDFAKYVNESWSRAMKDRKFVTMLSKYIKDDCWDHLEENYDESTNTLGAAFTMEESGIMYKGDAYSFTILDATEDTVDRVHLTMRTQYIVTSDNKDINFSNPVEVNGVPYNVDQYNAPVLKKQESDVEDIVLDAIAEWIREGFGSDENPNMTDTEFHSWANPRS